MDSENPSFFTENNIDRDWNKELIEKKEIIKEKAWLLQNLLSKKECDYLIECSEKEGFVDVAAGLRLYSDDELLCNTLWKRCQQYLPSEVCHNDSNWTLSRLNDYFRYGKYQSGLFFSAHVDASFFPEGPDGDIQSFLTLMIYLNDNSDFEGGNTNFFKPGWDYEIETVVQPKTGMAIVFYQRDQDLLHEGASVFQGCKYILRTDLIYEKQK